MNFLYVAAFSNGHIKVGRSVEPLSRIASHAHRVSCVGIDLLEHHIVECVGCCASAEAALIERCTLKAITKYKLEWFAGLNFAVVCEWANLAAKAPISHAQTFPNSVKAIRERLGLTQSALADGIGCTQGNVWHYEQGQTVPPDAAKRLIVFAASQGHEVTYEQIYGVATAPEAAAPKVEA